MYFIHQIRGAEQEAMGFLCNSQYKESTTEYDTANDTSWWEGLKWG